ncbi:MAG: NAD-dependent epimerase/dehydratase family protein [Zoogloeaceae bacterium]|jgi:UDP-glucose 4-epimerase|nr:NAD-dependent epimerase/dehydratase family protein [Zoogloeaceae bacterium]
MRNSAMRALVTGASGFIGRHLCRHLLAAGWRVRASTATDDGETALRAISDCLEIVRIPHFCDAREVWRAACRECPVVFHLAGLAHRDDGGGMAAETEIMYRRGNVDVTRALARAAAAQGVARFVLASSVTVYGEATPAGMPFTEISPTVPVEIYARSKLAAEMAVRAAQQESAGQPVFTIVRLPLVYGPGVRGNLRALMRFVASGLPLPLARLQNRRSFINIANLVDFLRHAATHADAANEILLVSDREDVSTPGLIRAIADGLDRPARLFPFPPGLLRTACSLLGQAARYEKLASSFQVDPARSCALLDWHPNTRLAEGVRQMCAAFSRRAA